jgi:hypothetical protein
MTTKSKNLSGSIDFLDLLKALDITQAFKTKGDLRRWSAKRTIGGLIATTACHDIYNNGISWMGVALCAVAVIPLAVSFLERE